jgi:hypothetical protein
LKCKNKHAFIRKFNPTSNEKTYHHPTFVQYKKKFHQFIFSLQYGKKNKRKEKRFKEEKNKNGNTLKGKNLKGMKLVTGVLGVALLCAFHGVTIENILF